MGTEKNREEKSSLHLRNKNRQRYDLDAMVVSCPTLKKHIQANKFGAMSINFSDPAAVKILNKAILIHYYGMTYWDFPQENLCPPIPGRAEYIHHIADLLAESNNGSIPMGNKVTCLDIGTGASCIYPIIGVSEYQWNFIGSDIDPKSILSSENIIQSNPSLQGKIICRKQNHPKHILKGVIGKNDKIDISICNPPFHESIAEAEKGSRRKIQNLTGQKTSSPKLNFSGNKNELVYEGGELQFISNMIAESKAFSKDCFWFTTLISKESNLKAVNRILSKNNPSETKTIEIKTGNKVTRVLAWTYLSPKEKNEWKKTKWS